MTRTGLPLLSAALSGRIAKLSLKKFIPVGARPCVGTESAIPIPKVDGRNVMESGATHASVDGSHQVGCLGPGLNDDMRPGPLSGEEEVTEPFVEHGLGPVSELSPHCGRYEFKPEGKVVAWDALISSQSPEHIVARLVERDRTLSFSHEANGVWVADRKVSGKEQHVQVHASGVAKLPENCRELASTVRSVVIVSEAL